MNKRADIQSFVVMLTILLVVAVVGIVFTKAFKDATNLLKQQEAIKNNTTVITTIEKAQSGTKFFDYLFLISFIGMSLGIVISSIFIDVHPAFLVVFIIGWIVVVVLGAIISNVFTEITETEQLMTTATSFKFTNAIMSKLPFYMFGIAMLTIIVLYGKSRMGM